MIPGSREFVVVVQNAQIDLVKFCFTEPVSNLSFILKRIMHNFYKMQKGRTIAFY